MDVQLSERAQRALRRLQPAADLGSSIEAVTLDALRLRLRLHDVADQLAGFEARYGRTFEQFAADWNAGRQADPFAHRVESADGGAARAARFDSRAVGARRCRFLTIPTPSSRHSVPPVLPATTVERVDRTIIAIKLRVDLDEHRFIDVFFNARNQRVDLAVIEHGQRIFGYDNLGGWHRHPREAPERHEACPEPTLETFIREAVSHT